VTDLLATLQELEHLGVGFVSLTEALDLTTPAGRAMAGLLAIFAEFEREILRERTRAGLAHARQNGKRLGGRQRRSRTQPRSGNSIVPASASRRSPAGSTSDAPPCAAFWAIAMNRSRKDPSGKIESTTKQSSMPARRTGLELVLLSGKQNQFPLPGEVRAAKVISPLKKVQPLRWSACAGPGLRARHARPRPMAGPTDSRPLAQLTAVGADKSTAEAIGDWHYWVAQGCCL